MILKIQYTSIPRVPVAHITGRRKLNYRIINISPKIIGFFDSTIPKSDSKKFAVEFREFWVSQHIADDGFTLVTINPPDKFLGRLYSYDWEPVLADKTKGVEVPENSRTLRMDTIVVQVVGEGEYQDITIVTNDLISAMVEGRKMPRVLIRATPHPLISFAVREFESKNQDPSGLSPVSHFIYDKLKRQEFLVLGLEDCIRKLKEHGFLTTNLKQKYTSTENKVVDILIREGFLQEDVDKALFGNLSNIKQLLSWFGK